MVKGALFRSIRRVLLGSLAVGPLAMPALGVTFERDVTFKITIENVSNNDTLMVPGGSPTKAPIAPGVVIVSSDTNPIFAPGKPAGADGLEALAEDGNFDALLASLQARYGNSAEMFVPGQQFEIKAKPGDRLSFATMFVQSNDKFFGPQDGSISLFDAGGKPISGNLTSLVQLYDAGTEKDELPGAGPNQAPRQKAMNQGTEVNDNVGLAQDGFTYPAVNSVIRLTITPVF